MRMQHILKGLLLSRAFDKESASGLEALPERSISEFPNFVTPEGLAQIDARVVALTAERGAAQERDDGAALARIDRDLRYWSQRQATARLMHPLAAPDSVQFGVQVTLKFADGALQTLRLVGEDEADPGQRPHQLGGSARARADRSARRGSGATVGNPGRGHRPRAVSRAASVAELQRGETRVEWILLQ